MTGKEILEQEFERAGMRGGYKTEEVDEFLQRIAGFVDTQQQQIDDLTYKIKVLAEKIEEYQSEEGNIRDALLSAQKLGTSILNESKSKAEAMLAEAQNTYDGMMAQAKAKVDSLTRDSMQKANIELNDLKKETDRERVNLERLKKEVGSFKAMILKQYKSHLDLLTSLPDFEPTLRAEKAAEQAKAAEEAKQRNAARQPASEPEEVEEAPRENSISEAELRAEQMEIERQSVEREFSTVAEEAVSPQVSEDKADEDDIEGQEVFVRPKTITSEILTNENELDEADKEQTREFGDGVAENEGKSPFGSSRKRPNYIEKFGELQFGSYDSKK